MILTTLCLHNFVIVVALTPFLGQVPVGNVFIYHVSSTVSLVWSFRTIPGLANSSYNLYLYLIRLNPLLALILQFAAHLFKGNPLLPISFVMSKVRQPLLKAAVKVGCHCIV